jgi:hypothetical protein
MQIRISPYLQVPTYVVTVLGYPYPGTQMLTATTAFFLLLFLLFLSFLTVHSSAISRTALGKLPHAHDTSHHPPR